LFGQNCKGHLIYSELACCVPAGRHEPQARAEELVRIADAVNLGEATALDEVLGALCGAGDKGGDCELSQDVIHALLRYVCIQWQQQAGLLR
jgi:hypothetical protein